MSNNDEMRSLIFGAEMGEVPEIDLHTTDSVSEGIVMLDFFLDQQFVLEERVVKIIHGRGTGVMKSAVEEHLCGHVHVDYYEQATHISEVGGVMYVVLTKKM